MKTDYPSRVDAWLAAVLVGAPLGVAGAGAFALTKSVAAGVVVMMTGLIIGLVIVALAVPCVYTLSDDSLKIRCGLLEEEVPLRKIRGAGKSSSLWSAPALSLQRVKVILEDGDRVISPLDRDRFIADLAARLRKARND